MSMSSFDINTAKVENGVWILMHDSLTRFEFTDLNQVLRHFEERLFWNGVELRILLYQVYIEGVVVLFVLVP